MIVNKVEHMSGTVGGLNCCDLSTLFTSDQVNEVINQNPQLKTIYHNVQVFQLPDRLNAILKNEPHLVISKKRQEPPMPMPMPTP